MTFRTIQNPLAVLCPGIHSNDLFGVSGCFFRAGIHAVPVQVGHETPCSLFVLLVVKLGLQKILVFPEEILREILCNIQAVFNTVQSLICRQIKKIVDGDSKDLCEHRQLSDIRHGGSVLPFGDRLRSDTQFFGELILRQSCFETKLSDFLSEFHIFYLHVSSCFDKPIVEYFHSSFNNLDG